MKIKTLQYINLSDVALLIGMDYSDLAECYENNHTWGDTAASLITIQEFVQILDDEDRNKVMNVLTSTQDPDTVSRLLVNLAD